MNTEQMNLGDSDDSDDSGESGASGESGNFDDSGYFGESGESGDFGCGLDAVWMWSSSSNILYTLASMLKICIY